MELSEGTVRMMRERSGGTRQGWEILASECAHDALVLEAMRDEAVIRARVMGASWSDVGALLGISRQAAAKRYAPLVEDWAAVQ